MPTSYIALLSGGLDSTVAAFLARQQGSIVESVIVHYGQHAAEREVEAVKRIAKHLGSECRVIELPFLAEVTRTALVMNEKVIPQIKMGQLDDRSETQKSAQQVWVPNRNGLFLNIAAAIAEGKGVGEILVGFNAEEAVTFPDNSANFVERANRFFELSTLGKIKVFAPTQGMNKTEIVRKGLELDVPFGDVWSCYRGGKRMCGKCESCLRSIRAYQRAGVWEQVKGRFDADCIPR